MEVHSGTYDDAGNVVKKSKSEILFCPAPARCYYGPHGAHGHTAAAPLDAVDMSDVKLPGGRFMQVVTKFPYLGSWVAANCGDAEDVDSRVSAASRAFGALRVSVFATKSVNRAAKQIAYERLVLAILLYGCECWCLSESLLARLRVFHAQCLRVMSRVTRKHTREHHISTQALGQELGLESIDFYIARRQLRWAGHVARMPFDRLPRRMLSSWVASKRPTGAPTMTYGRTLKKALKKFDIDIDTWHERAQDRGWWQETLRLGRPATRRSQRIAARPRTQLPLTLRPRPRPHPRPCSCRVFQDFGTCMCDAARAGFM